MTRQEMLALLYKYGAIVEKRLVAWLDNSALCVTPRLLEAMKHSLLAGGKRLRPTLFFAWAESCNGDIEKLSGFAAAIEMIHTYSLIHDDLPAMDNADLRRGKPSCHKKFGEATAMLAGDALLTDAFYLASKTDANAENLLNAIRILSLAAGGSGMVDGQMRDLYSGMDSVMTRSALEILQAKKTGAMFAASCQCGVILADGSLKYSENAYNFGLHLGAAFQIYDDVLDIMGDAAQMGKPAGLDAINERTSWPCIIGLEESLLEARREAAMAISLTDSVQEPQGSFLRSLVDYVVNRKN